MTERRLYLVAYDIVEPRRRARALKACKAHGLGGQKSVHECWLSASERRELERALRRIFEPKTDRLLFVRFDPRSDVSGLGRARQPPEPPWFFVG